MTFAKILEKYRTEATTEREKGGRFERLMHVWLQTEPIYKDRFEHVWLWNKFPYRKDFGGSDIGIDIVAKTHAGDYWAIQCKCYQENTSIDKASVDGFLATSGRTFKDEATKTMHFSHRLWISTTNNWSEKAEGTIRNQTPPVSRVSLTDLESSPVDWAKLEQDIHGSEAQAKKKDLRDHQQAALDACHEHFKTADRGSLIMACGTGKTFTSLKIAEKETGGKGLVLFLVPSIALLGQTLREWSAEASEPLNAICVCSDPQVGRNEKELKNLDGYSLVDLALPACTDSKAIAEQIIDFRNTKKRKNLIVVFSTYQSIEVVSKALQKLPANADKVRQFDLIICDEAHRTTGVTLADAEESAFVRVHDNKFLPSRKRLYMTATPRLYTDDAKAKAKEADAILCSMNDPELYGKEFYRLGFGEAVEKQLLADYKVLVLTISESEIPEALQKAIADETKEINSDDASKLVGCINALSKQMLLDKELLVASDPGPMRCAIAFCSNIKDSKRIVEIFNSHKDTYYSSLSKAERAKLVSIEAEHVDGTMGASLRDKKLGWLKITDNSPATGNDCHILCNVRCLSEGVDVPALDAVLFLSPRNSQIDVVQSVGRVMRTAPGKKYGYIIIPVVIPANVNAEDALDDNNRFKVVWTVLNALRAHDDRFNAQINKIELNKNKPSARDGGGTVLVGRIPHENADGEAIEGNGRNSAAAANAENNAHITKRLQQQFLLQFEDLRTIIYARMVIKVGDKQYWEQWAASIGDIAKSHTHRISRLIGLDGEHRIAFDSFLADLKKNINPAVTKDQAIEMLAQHIITQPIFEALFENYSFVKDNPVSQAMENMLSLLEKQALEKNQESLKDFYASVQKRASGIDNAEGKQRIIIKLYDSFFRLAFPQVASKLGIVFTPVEAVDYIIHSVAAVLKTEFGRTLADENVHILDPFTGTGTFITRLLQSGYIDGPHLERKYRSELHANEIVLLAYYIASINIENAYHEEILKAGKKAEYSSFPGICLTDTFQLYEDDGSRLTAMFPENSSRIDEQRKAPLRIIFGNPPYSVGQKSANDNAQNQKYSNLERRINKTYVELGNATNVNALYDSYFKAFRWASDKLDPINGGIIAFVTNGGWLNGNSFDGFRKCIEKEFSTIYVFNLRGNCNYSGEPRRREGDNIFDIGSRTPIAITLLVKKPGATGEAVIKYRDIGDYLVLETKLSTIATLKSLENPDMNWTILRPNRHGDWLAQRDEQFSTYIALGSKTEMNDKIFFESVYGRGLETGRDAWCYNSSKTSLRTNLTRSIEFYNAQVKGLRLARKTQPNLAANDYINRDSKQFSWDYPKIASIEKLVSYSFSQESLVIGLYRPFFKQWAYFNREINHRIQPHPKLFPTPKHGNLVICVPGISSNKEQMPLISDCIPDLHLNGDTQAFPLYWYEKQEAAQEDLFDNNGADTYTRHNAITDFIHNQARAQYGIKVTKEDIFYYVYGFLHSPAYRSTYSADLKKMLPRVPLVNLPKDFWAFSKAGRELAELHLNYEKADPYPLVEQGTAHNLKVRKMCFASKADKSSIVYNSNLTLSGIPPRAHEYVVNGKSALAWLIDRYQVTTHKESGIINDPNDWCTEVNNPRYIVDLVKRIVTVSLKTLDIIDALPAWQPEAATPVIQPVTVTQAGSNAAPQKPAAAKPDGAHMPAAGHPEEATQKPAAATVPKDAPLKPGKAARPVVQPVSQYPMPDPRTNEEAASKDEK